LAILSDEVLFEILKDVAIMQWQQWKKKIAFKLLALRDFYDTYLSKSLSTVMTPLGFTMVGGNSQHHRAMQQGKFETIEVTWLQKELQSVDLFVDIGANIGYFTCLARSMNKRVIAVEPMQKNLDYLLKNIESNQGLPVEVYQAALSSQVGVLRLYGASSTGASLVRSWAGASNLISRLVPVTTLDKLLFGRSHQGGILIKMDVEGAEYDVLRGALMTINLAKRPVWLIEITLGQFMPQGTNVHFFEIFDLFFACGYTCQLLTSNGLIAVDSATALRWSKQGHSDYSEINYVFS
jgi:FkbM family methyltransferase